MTVKTVFSSAARFDAVRQLAGAQSGLHGHGFGVDLRCVLPANWAEFPGAEVAQLAQCLQACVAPLGQGLLNAHMDPPTDTRIARWLQQRLAAEGLLQPQIGLHSGPNRGLVLDAQGRGQVWRRYTFQSAHRLPHVPLGHKCGRMHGHGFGLTLHAEFDPAQDTQALVSEQLDALWAPLYFALNYACLNEQPGLDNPTSEVMASWFWQRLQPQLPSLRRVTVHETASCGASYDGQQHRIWKDLSLDSSLRLKRAPASSPLSRLHGHSYALRLHLSAPLDPVLGWTVDFGEVKTRFKPLFKALDHHSLHEIAELPDCDAASLAAWILAQARGPLPQLYRVDLMETQGCGAMVTIPAEAERFEAMTFQP